MRLAFDTTGRHTWHPSRLLEEFLHTGEAVTRSLQGLPIAAAFSKKRSAIMRMMQISLKSRKTRTVRLNLMESFDAQMDTFLLNAEDKQRIQNEFQLKCGELKKASAAIYQEDSDFSSDRPIRLRIVNPVGVALREDASYPGDRIGNGPKNGDEVHTVARRTVQHTEEDGTVRDIHFYQLSAESDWNGRWIHDFISSDPERRGIEIDEVPAFGADLTSQFRFSENIDTTLGSILCEHFASRWDKARVSDQLNRECAALLEGGAGVSYTRCFSVIYFVYSPCYNDTLQSLRLRRSFLRCKLPSIESSNILSLIF